MPNNLKSGDQDEVNINLFDNAGLSHEVAETLRAIARVADANGTKAYLVGGIVREFASRRRHISTSPDITIIGDAESFANALTLKLPSCQIVATSKLHTAKIKTGDITVDVASARTDLYDPWGSLPKITLVDNIETDLSRRDFSINAMAIPLRPNGYVSIIDPFNGLKDAKDGFLRAIRPDAFREDPLRIMRGIRLAARYDYRFDPTTESQISESIEDLLRMTRNSPQRVFNEFRLWFSPHENLDSLVELANRFDVLKALGIGAEILADAFSNFPTEETDLARFAAFAYLIPPEESRSLAKRLLMPSSWTEIANDAADAHTIARRCREGNVTDLELHRSLTGVNPSVVRSVAFVEHDNAVGARFKDFQNRLRHIKPGLTGDDLINLGVPQGPRIGMFLDELLALRIDGQISTADEERQHVLNRLSDD